jgi:hypothetical protein
MATEFNLEALNRILANEILERIGINVIDISYAFNQEEEQVLVEQQPEAEYEDKNSFKYLQQKEDEAWELARKQEEKIDYIEYQDRQYDADQAQHRRNSYRSEHETDSLSVGKATYRSNVSGTTVQRIALTVHDTHHYI